MGNTTVNAAINPALRKIKVSTMAKTAMAAPKIKICRLFTLARTLLT